jgi:hypothetical protein
MWSIWPALPRLCSFRTMAFVPAERIGIGRFENTVFKIICVCHAVMIFWRIRAVSARNAENQCWGIDERAADANSAEESSF